MRVLLTTDTVGGVWTFTRELASGLLELGHAVAVVSVGHAPAQGQMEWVREMQQSYRGAFRFEASNVSLEWMEKNSCAYSDAEQTLLELIVEFGVDVLHTSQFCFGALPVPVPKVMTAHSDVLSWAEACRPKGLDDSRWLRNYRNLVEAGLEGASAVVAPTRSMAEALARHFPSCGVVRVVSNGRTLEPANGRSPRNLQAVTMGRLWDEAKGLAVLAEVTPCMPILLVGDASFENDQAPELESVIFLERLAEEGLFDLLRSSSLYLATSIYEPFGLAPLEAALCGCGVLARAIPSLREVWGDAAEYFTDGKELGALLSSLRASPEKLGSLQERSMRRALEFTAARTVEEYVSLYEELLASLSVNEQVAAYAF